MINSAHVFSPAGSIRSPARFGLKTGLEPIHLIRTRASNGKSSEVDNSVSRNIEDLTDPEAELRRSAKPPFFRNWFDTAPQIRVRRADDRAKDQLADLAIINERLAMRNDAETAVARQRLDYLKRRRKNWEMVYQYITKKDALCTLSAIEQANKKVEELLSEETRESSNVSDLKRQLQDLQQEIAQAHSSLRSTQSRVDSNLKHINELKLEAAKLENLRKSISQTSMAIDSAYQQEVYHAAAVAAKQQQQQGISFLDSESDTDIDTDPSFPQSKYNDMTLVNRRSRGLQSTMDLEDELKNHWFAVHFSSKLDATTLLPFELFDEPWVLFRDDQGRASCVRDECAHRACPLSLGSVVDGEVQCAYHGWRFNGAGDCTVMPSTKFCRGVRVSALPVVEADGLVWVWPGWMEAGPPPTGVASAPDGYQIHTEIEMDVPVEHGLLVENLLDLAHAPFTHTTTFAKGWPVPDIVQFQAARMLSGTWQPYPIDMEFRPPCVTVSLIGLAQPGKIQRNVVAADCKNHLHQVHVCLPTKRGHTRLLYRMSMDFMGWTRYVPGIQAFWKSIAAQVLGEDLVLVAGQQDRMQRGGDTWSHPVSYDKLAVRYRRWRNSVASGSAGLSNAATRSRSNDDDRSSIDNNGVGENGKVVINELSMNAGDLFSIDDDDDENVYMDTIGVPADLVSE